MSPDHDEPVRPPSAIARRMLGFERDAAGEWVARLECGHRRHVRHRPPLSIYPWIADADARAAKLGSTLECPACARLELPTDAVAYRTTAEFDEATLPPALRRDHDTRPGVWARVEVLAGRLRFVLPELGLDRILTTGEHAIVAPELSHHVEPLGPMRMRLAFLRAPTEPQI